MVKRFFCVGLPGLEPGKAGPESAVLPLHHSPNNMLLFSIASAKVRQKIKSEKFYLNTEKGCFFFFLTYSHIYKFAALMPGFADTAPPFL